MPSSGLRHASVGTHSRAEGTLGRAEGTVSVASREELGPAQQPCSAVTINPTSEHHL
jgi:hypothetical protein